MCKRKYLFSPDMASLLQTAKENDGAEPEVSHLLSTSGTASFLDFIDRNNIYGLL